MLLQATATTANIGSPITAYWPVMIFFAVAVVFPVLPIILGRFIRPAVYGKGKMRPYECGIDPTTDAHSRFTVRYYIVAMLFLIFDVETIFLLPWAIIFMGEDFSFTKFALDRDVCVYRNTCCRLLLRLAQGRAGMGVMIRDEG